MSYSPIAFLLKQALEQCLVKSPVMNKQLHKEAFMKQDLNRDC